MRRGLGKRITPRAAPAAFSAADTVRTVLHGRVFGRKKLPYSTIAVHSASFLACRSVRPPTHYRRCEHAEVPFPSAQPATARRGIYLPASRSSPCVIACSRRKRLGVVGCVCLPVVDTKIPLTSDLAVCFLTADTSMVGRLRERPPMPRCPLERRCSLERSAPSLRRPSWLPLSGLSASYKFRGKRYG